MGSPGRVRVVALFEGAKGFLVLLAGFGLLSLLHRNVQGMAESIVRRLHLNPARGYPRIFLEVSATVTDGRVRILALGAAVYAAIRLVEPYGLWRGRRWAEWVAAVSGAVYLPIELYELSLGVTWPKVVVLLVNTGIVACVGRELLPTAGRSAPRIGGRPGAG